MTSIVFIVNMKIGFITKMKVQQLQSQHRRGLMEQGTTSDYESKPISKKCAEKSEKILKYARIHKYHRTPPTVDSHPLGHDQRCHNLLLSYIDI